MSKKPLKLLPADHSRTIFQFAPEAGLDPAELQDPLYWGNVARNLRVGDEIIVVPQDAAWRAHLFVRAVGKVEATVQVLSMVTLGEEVTEAAGGYAVKFRGQAKWAVIVAKTGEVIRTGFDTKQQASAFMAEHTKAMA